MSLYRFKVKPDHVHLQRWTESIVSVLAAFFIYSIFLAEKGLAINDYQVIALAISVVTGYFAGSFRENEVNDKKAQAIQISIKVFLQTFIELVAMLAFLIVSFAIVNSDLIRQAQLYKYSFLQLFLVFIAISMILSVIVYFDERK